MPCSFANVLGRSATVRANLSPSASLDGCVMSKPSPRRQSNFASRALPVDGRPHPGRRLGDRHRVALHRLVWRRFGRTRPAPSEVIGNTINEYFQTDDEAAPPIAAHRRVCRVSRSKASRFGRIAVTGFDSNSSATRRARSSAASGLPKTLPSRRTPKKNFGHRKSSIASCTKACGMPSSALT